MKINLKKWNERIIKEESLKDKFIFYKLFNEDEGTFLNELQKIEKMYVGEIYGNNYR